MKSKTLEMVEVPDFEVEQKLDGNFHFKFEDKTIAVEIAAPQVVKIMEAITGDIYVGPSQAQQILGMTYARLSTLVKCGKMIAFGDGDRNTFKLGHLVEYKLTGALSELEDTEA